MPKAMTAHMLVGVFGAIMTGVMFGGGHWQTGSALLAILVMQGVVIWRKFCA